MNFWSYIRKKQREICSQKQIWSSSRTSWVCVSVSVCVCQVRRCKWFPAPLWGPDGAEKQSTSKTFTDVMNPKRELHINISQVGTHARAHTHEKPFCISEHRSLIVVEVRCFCKLCN